MQLQLYTSQQMDFDQELLQDPILQAKYEFLSRLGEGCFGKIYKVKNKQLKINTALKIEVLENPNKKSMLQNQADILKKIQNKPFVPCFYSYGQWSLGAYLEIQLLQKDLTSLVEKTFSIDQVSTLTVKLLQSLSVLHNNQIIHQDIKPQNIMFNNKGQYIFIDFGISKKLKDNYKYQKEAKKIKGFIGTPRYASVQAHKGLQQSKKDDLESLMYNIAYLFFKKLPWLSLKVSGSKKIEQIKNSKIKTAENVFQNMGKNYVHAFQYIKRLEHMEQPNYKYLTTIFKRSHSMIIQPIKKREFGSNIQNRQEQFVKRNDIKKLSLNLNQKSGKFLQLPNFANRSKFKQLDQISQRSKASSYAQISNQMSGSMGASKGLSVRVYNQSENTNEQSQQSLEKDMNLKSEDNIQPSVPNISKFFNALTIKNPFAIDH